MPVMSMLLCMMHAAGTITSPSGNFLSNSEWMLKHVFPLFGILDLRQSSAFSA